MRARESTARAISEPMLDRAPAEVRAHPLHDDLDTMMGERTYPVFPFADMDGALDVYRSLGFQVTFLNAGPVPTPSPPVASCRSTLPRSRDLIPRPRTRVSSLRCSGWTICIRHFQSGSARTSSEFRHRGSVASRCIRASRSERSGWASLAIARRRCSPRDPAA